jgi:hypothetical protein
MTTKASVIFGAWKDEDEMFLDFFKTGYGGEDRSANERSKARAKVKKILFACYGTGSYEGAAYVLFRGTDGKLYDVHASHCSCYGLEGQWTPEPVKPKNVLDEIGSKYPHNWVTDAGPVAIAALVGIISKLPTAVALLGIVAVCGGWR